MSDPKVYCAHDEMVEVEKLVPHPRNPNTHPFTQIELLSKVIQAQGWRAPITVSKMSGFITKGHGRLQAARSAGCLKVPVDYQDYENEAAEHADMIADNRLAELAEIDKAILKDLLQDLDDGAFDMDLTGFDVGALEDLLAPIIDPEITDPPVPEFQDKIMTEPGRIYQLGKHRLMCGDSTSESDVERLMDGEKADMVFTDPPWNVDYGAETNGGRYKDRKILNDSMSSGDFAGFMAAAFACMAAASVKGAMTYVVMGPQEWGRMMDSLEAADYHWSSTIIWNKSSLVMARKDYHTKYEPIWYGWLSGAPRNMPLEDRKQCDVWDIERPTKSEDHPTMKPMELVDRAIQNSSKANSTVLDPFGGSGTTLIAAEQTGRACRMMELDPKYCDVIVRRYAALVDADDAKIFETGVHSC